MKTILMHVTVSDGKGEDTKNLAIEIIDVNEAPQFARNDYHVYGNEGKVCFFHGFILLKIKVNVCIIYFPY